MKDQPLTMSMFLNKGDLERAQKQAELVGLLMAIGTGDLFNALVRRVKYDGRDMASITLGEMERAIDGAKLP